MKLHKIFKKILEQKLATMKIAWIRKDGGLQLALFGKPIIKITEEAISIGSDTAGHNNSKCHQWLEIRHGDLTSPNCDPETTINKILTIADSINTLMDQATNTNQVQEMRMINLPAGSSRKAITEGFAKRGIKVKTTIRRGMITAKDDQNHQWLINQIRKDGTGKLYTFCYSKQGIYPLDIILDEHVRRMGES